MNVCGQKGVLFVFSKIKVGRGICTGLSAGGGPQGKGGDPNGSPGAGVFQSCKVCVKGKVDWEIEKRSGGGGGGQD